MEGQHQQVATPTDEVIAGELLHRVHEELSIWRDSVTVESREALVDALDRLTRR